MTAGCSPLPISTPSHPLELLLLVVLHNNREHPIFQYTSFSHKQFAGHKHNKSTKKFNTITTVTLAYEIQDVLYRLSMKCSCLCRIKRHIPGPPNIKGTFVQLIWVPKKSILFWTWRRNVSHILQNNIVYIIRGKKKIGNVQSIALNEFQ